MLVGILANLDESALKHIVSNKERHIQITGFAFFDQFLTHSHSKKDKRFSELQGNKLTGFLDCLRKSLQDVDVDVLLSKKFGYAQQLSRDLNLLCYCSQVMLNPRFSIRLNSILSTFPNEAQIIDTLIPLSDQSLLPLSQMLQDASDEKPDVSSIAASDSFFPKETLSYHLNNESLHRIRHSEAQESAEQGPFALPNLSTSRPMAMQSLEPFEFLQTRHPLTEIALMIENMKAGKLTINGAQKIRIELDPESKELFNPHESALFENPGSFFYLYDLVERMNAQTIAPDQQAVLETFNALDDHLRKSIASLIYQLSDNPAKKTIPNWGETHAADDLSLMLKAIKAVKNNIFDFSYEKIKARATSLIESLSQEKQRGIYYEIYRIAKPITEDSDWGANNALVKVSRLVAALHIRQALPGPKLLSYPETTEELSLPLAPSLTPDLDISHDPHITTAFSQPASTTPILSEVSEPKANQHKHHPFFELASMIEKWQAASLTLTETQNIVFHLDDELEALFALHEQAFIADPFTYFNLSELVGCVEKFSFNATK